MGDTAGALPDRARMNQPVRLAEISENCVPRPPSGTATGTLITADFH